MIYSYLKDSLCTEVKRDAKFEPRYVKGVPLFVNRRYTKGEPFLPKVLYKKGKGLDLGAEPRSHSKIFLIPPPPPPIMDTLIIRTAVADCR